MFARMAGKDLAFSSHDTGFTLLELLIVVAIFSLLAAIAIPNWSALLPTYALNSAARQVQSELNRIRMMAVSKNARYQFDVSNAPSRSYRLRHEGATLNTKFLPQGIEVIEAANISFTSRGTSTSDRVKLRNGKGACRQVVVSGTGRVRVCRPGGCNANC